MVMFLAGMSRVEFLELPEHRSPCRCLLLCVINVWQGLSTFIERNIAHFITPKGIWILNRGSESKVTGHPCSIYFSVYTPLKIGVH
jgi:hypothetical protein